MFKLLKLVEAIVKQYYKFIINDMTVYQCSIVDDIECLVCTDGESYEQLTKQFLKL